MSRDRPLNLIWRVLRHPRKAVSQLRRIGVDDPLWLAMRLGRVLPPAWQRRIYPRLLRLVDGLVRRQKHPDRSLVVLALLTYLNGGGGCLRELLGSNRPSRPRGTALLARLCAHLGWSEEALRLVAEVPLDATSRLTRAIALTQRGRLREAENELIDAARTTSNGSAAKQLTRLRGELQVLGLRWQPSVRQARGTPQRPGRILHLINNSLPYVQSGYTVRTHHLALAQRGAGLDPVLVTPAGFPWRQSHLDAPDRTDLDELPYVHLLDEGPPRWGTLPRIEDTLARIAPRLRELRPSALHPTTPHPNGRVALALGAELGVPVVYEVRGFLEDTWLSRQPAQLQSEARSSDHYRLSRAAETWCADRADHVVTLSEGMKDDLVARGLPPGSITIVPNAVDPERFTPSPDRVAGAAIRRRLGLERREVLVGYSGSLLAYEGLDQLIAATRLLLDRGERRVRTLIVGDGPERPYLQELASSLGVDGTVSFVGRVRLDEVPRYLEAMDVFVVPRRDERVCRLVAPLKPVEAMAMELPLVVSWLPALEELVDGGRAGRAFLPDSPHHLADALEPLVDDPCARRQLGEHARDMVLSDRTWAANGRRYARIFDDLGVARPPHAA